MRIPMITGEYIPIYIPSPDVFPGPDSYCFEAGKKYNEWVTNDFTVIRGHDNQWHAFGITHPAPPDYNPPLTYNSKTIHDGEWLLFHSISEEGTFKDALKAGSWKDQPKILCPAQRPGEEYNIYAPHVIQINKDYFMVYGPNPIRIAYSKDLYHWEPKGKLFSGHESSRDPNLIFFEGNYIMTYVSENNLLSRSSKNLINWSEPTKIFSLSGNGAPESPFIVQYDGFFYLFYCIWDGENGPYDNRTFVYCSNSPYSFSDKCFITQIQAHAPEIICDEAGNWFILSAEWPHRGVSVAPLNWI